MSAERNLIETPYYSPWFSSAIHVHVHTMSVAHNECLVLLALTNLLLLRMRSIVDFQSRREWLASQSKSGPYARHTVSPHLLAALGMGWWTIVHGLTSFRSHVRTGI